MMQDANDSNTEETNSTSDIEAQPTASDTGGLPDELDGCDAGKLILPGSRIVPNCCAICLCPYERGDGVVWSRNKHDDDEVCPHAFHMDCMVEWLVRQDYYEVTPCPCCRRDFIHKSIVLKTQEENKIRWDTIAFDVRNVRLH